MCLKGRLVNLLPTHTLARALGWVEQNKDRSFQEVDQIQKKFINAWKKAEVSPSMLLHFLLQTDQAPKPALVELLRHGTKFGKILGENLVHKSSSYKDVDSLIYLVPLLITHVSELESKVLFLTRKSWWTRNLRPYTLLALLVTSVHALFYIPDEGSGLQLPPHLVFKKAMCLISAFVHSAVRAPVLSRLPLDAVFQDPETAAVAQLELRCSLVSLRMTVLPFLEKWMFGVPACSSNPKDQRIWCMFWQLRKKELCEFIEYGLKNASELFNLAPSCLLYTSPSPRDATLSRMPSSA